MSSQQRLRSAVKRAVQQKIGGCNKRACSALNVFKCGKAFSISIGAFSRFDEHTHKVFYPLCQDLPVKLVYVTLPGTGRFSQWEGLGCTSFPRGSGADFLRYDLFNKRNITSEIITYGNYLGEFATFYETVRQNHLNYFFLLFQVL